MRKKVALMMDLSVVIVEYFCLDDVVACIARLRDCLAGVTHEIVVVSNSAYGDDEKKSMRAALASVHCIFNETNAGFGKAVNQGMRQAIGDVVLIINADVYCGAAIKPVLDFLKEREHVGLVGPQIVDAAGTIQDSCRRFMGIREFVQRQWVRIRQSHDVIRDPRVDYALIREVDWVIGACMFIKKSVIDRIGYFDEGYFFYVEDMDFCKRCWAEGFQVVYYPNLFVRYKGDRKSIKPFIYKTQVTPYTSHHLKSYCRFLWKYRGWVTRRSRLK